MTGIEQEIAQLSEAALMEVRQAASPEELEALRVKYLGRKGSLTKVLRGLKDLGAHLAAQVRVQILEASQNLGKGAFATQVFHPEGLQFVGAGRLAHLH